MDQDVDFSALSKKERKRLKREMERQEQEKKGRRGTIVKLLVIVILLGLLGVGGWLIVKELSKPLPGQQLSDQGRDHVAKEQWEKFSYNSNPPTSGPHDVVWTKAGVYDSPQGDGHLVHSLEHGYVILSYNCNSEKLEVTRSTSSGQGSEKLEVATGTSETMKTATLPPQLSQQECDNLKKQLSDLANDKKLWKLIVVPRENLDARLALTAWTRIMKLNDFDRDNIAAFIDAHRNHGPEQTME